MRDLILVVLKGLFAIWNLSDWVHDITICGKHLYLFNTKKKKIATKSILAQIHSKTICQVKISLYEMLLQNSQIILSLPKLTQV